jgi:hypothetical protein
LAVRSIVPFAPLAHTTRSLAALTPLSREVTPLVCGCHRGAELLTGAESTAAVPSAMTAEDVFTRAFCHEADGFGRCPDPHQ